MRLRWSVKASQTNRVMLMGLNMQGPVPHPKYGLIARESYERNIPVYACISEIAKAAGSVPWLLYKQGKSASLKSATRMMTPTTAQKSAMYHGTRAAVVHKALESTQIEQHPLLKLLEQPNNFQSQAEYIAQGLSYWLISGNSYEEFLGPLTGPNKGKPLEMYNLRPDRINILPSKDPEKWIEGYEYKVNDKAVTFEPSAILHRKFFHPTNDFYGLSPLQVAMRAYQTDNLSLDWNYALIQNQARPSGALIAPTAVSDDSYERIKQEIKDSYSGSISAGLPIFLENGLKWEPLSLSPLELDWLAGAKDLRRLICAIFNVPPELIGDSEARTYNSFPEARRAFWMEAVLPLLDAIRDSYNHRLTSLYGSGLFLDYDRDQIDALAEEQAKVWARVGGSKHLSINEMREATGYETWDGDPEEDNPADVPIGLLPKSGPEFPVDGQVPGQLSKPDPTKSGLRLIETAVKDGTPVTVTPEDAQRIMREITQKGQRLSGRQKSALARMRKGLSGMFKEQGQALATHLTTET